MNHNVSKFVRHRAVLSEKFIALSAYTENEEIFQINNLRFYLKNLEKEGWPHGSLG